MIILVTGTSSGFGLAIRRHLIDKGHKVYGSSRNSDAADPYVLAIDVRDAESVRLAVDKVIEREGRIDVLINNAGMGIGGAAELATQEEVDLQMGTNFMGCVNMCRAVLPYMRSQRKGMIINISSIAGRFAIPYQGMYSASKFAIEGYSQALALEIKQFGIKIVCVNPGDFNTGFTKARKISQLTTDSEDYKQSFARVLKNVEKDELGGGNPDMLARRIGKIVEKRNPRFHYIVAKDPIQTLSVYLSMILPQNFFHWIIRLFYSV
jgi:NAD(P)-dependent dehydrogenase (short-subunit alcohol dehydrogenase family)